MISKTLQIANSKVEVAAIFLKERITGCSSRYNVTVSHTSKYNVLVTSLSQDFRMLMKCRNIKNVLIANCYLETTSIFLDKPFAK
jgi:hypothetical protein